MYVLAVKESIPLPVLRSSKHQCQTPVLVTHDVTNTDAPSRGPVARLTFMSRCSTFFWCMKLTPAQTWRMKMAHAFSVRT